MKGCLIPGLEGRPVIVLSNNDGCAISRTEEAKALGIAMAAPAFMMRKLIEKHNVVVFSSNYTLYGDMSGGSWKHCHFLFPPIELYSIDEAFLDLETLAHTDLLKLGFSNPENHPAEYRDSGFDRNCAQPKPLQKWPTVMQRKIHGTAVFWAANAATHRRNVVGDTGGGYLGNRESACAFFIAVRI